MISDQQLQIWATRQRKNYRNGQLPEDRRTQLESLFGWKWGTAGSSPKTPREWVSVARRLAKGDGGLLPGTKQLRDGGYSGLALVIKNNPELFSVIKQARKWIPWPQARRWARMGLSGQAEWQNFCKKGQRPKNIPTMPSDVYPKKWRGWADWLGNKRPVVRTREERVNEAEKLVKRYGKLPNRKALDRAGHGGLTQVMYHHPTWFAHIPKSPSLKRGVKDWIRVAEQLAKNNGGLIPPLGDKLQALRTIIKRYPKAFKHLEQDSQTKIAVRKQLATYSNLLADKKVPRAQAHARWVISSRWLQHNGYCGLSGYRWAHPQAFRDVERQFGVPRLGKFVPHAPAP